MGCLRLPLLPATGATSLFVSHRSTHALASSSHFLFPFTCCYVFGQAIEGRKYEVQGHRFDFNGKETDEETELQDYGFRFLDVKVGRFTQVDPLSGKFPWLSTFQFASNSPIHALDLDGMEARYSNKGVFLGWGKEKGDNAKVHIETQKVDANGKLHTSVEETDVTYNTFRQLAAMAYNEGGASNELDKFRIANAIVNKVQLIDPRKQKTEPDLQSAIDNTAFTNDSDEKRLTRGKKDWEKVQQRKGQSAATGAASYYEYSTTDIIDRNKKPLMVMATAGAINAISRNSIDYSNGATHWRGRGTFNLFWLNNPFDEKGVPNPNAVPIDLNYIKMPAPTKTVPPDKCVLY